MLRLLTDEQISPAVARQASGRSRSLSIVSLHTWQEGQLLGSSDEFLLSEAHKQRMTLVTFDLRTIPTLLRAWAEQGLDHSGVVLVDERTIAQNNTTGLVAALCALGKAEKDVSWINRVIYLRAHES